MRILSAVQAIFAIVFLLFGVVLLFGIGITGLLFLVPAAVFAAAAAITQENSRAGIAVALAVDAVLATVAARRLEALFASATAGIKLPPVRALGNPGLLDYLPPCAGADWYRRPCSAKGLARCAKLSMVLSPASATSSLWRPWHDALLRGQVGVSVRVATEQFENQGAQMLSRQQADHIAGDILQQARSSSDPVPPG